MKRIMLTTFALCFLVGSLALTSGTVHAQARVDLVSRHVAIPADGYTYGFTAGWWGWGVCISHNDLQSMQGDSNGVAATSAVLSRTSLAQVAGRVAYASVAIAAILWFVSWEDQGNGMCFAWPFWLPSSVPFMWSQ